MFRLFKRDPAKKRQKQHKYLLFVEVHLQRKGDIMGYSLKTQKAELIQEQILALKNLIDSKKKAYWLDTLISIFLLFNKVAVSAALACVDRKRMMLPPRSRNSLYDWTNFNYWFITLLQKS